MRNIFILFLLITWSSLFSQEVCTLSEQAISINYYGGSDFDSFYDIAFVEDNNIICFGLTRSLNGQVSNPIGDLNWWLMKVNEFGDIVWEKSLNADDSNLNDNDFFFSEILNDGNYLFASKNFESLESGNTGYFGVLVVDPQGNIVWENQYDLQTIGDLIPTSDGGFIVISDEILLTKFDEDGNISWQKTFPIELENIWRKESLNIVETTDGGFVFTAGVEENQLNPWYGSSDIWVVKVAPNGEIVWEQVIGGSEKDYPFELIATSDQSIIITGRTSSNNIDFNSIECTQINVVYRMKLNDDGEIIWNKCYTDDNDLLSQSTSFFSLERSFTYASGDGFMVALTEFNSNGEFVKFFEGDLEPIEVFLLAEGAKKNGRKIVYYGGVNTDGFIGGFGFYDAFLNIIDISDLETTNVSNVNNSNINLSPNPVQNIINLNGSLESFKNYSVFSLNGIKQNSGVLNSKSIDVRNLQAGVYILSLYSENNRRSIRFIKQ